LQVRGVSALRRSVIVQDFQIGICSSPSGVCRFADPNEGGVVNLVKGEGIRTSLTSVDVSTVVENKVGLWQRRRAVDALVGAVLEADAADDIGG
jgi:hypothetical protein